MTAVLTMRTSEGVVMVSDGLGIVTASGHGFLKTTLTKAVRTASGVLIGCSNEVEFGLDVVRRLGLETRAQMTADQASQEVFGYFKANEKYLRPVSFLFSDTASIYQTHAHYMGAAPVRVDLPAPFADPYGCIGLERLLANWFMRNCTTAGVSRLVHAAAYLRTAVEAIELVSGGVGTARVTTVAQFADGTPWNAAHDQEVSAAVDTYRQRIRDVFRP